MPIRQIRNTQNIQRSKKKTKFQKRMSQWTKDLNKEFSIELLVIKMTKK